jgi:hypothetical protein
MAAFAGGDDIGAVVAEIGHYSTKIGWAGDDAPRSYFPSVRILVFSRTFSFSVARCNTNYPMQP